MRTAFSASRLSSARISVTRSRARCLRTFSTSPAGRTVRSSAADLVCRQLRRGTAEQQIAQHCLQLVGGANSSLGEVDASFVEQGQGRGVIVQVHLTPVSVDVGRGSGGSIDPVVLAAATTGELTDAAGRRGGYIHDGLAAGDEPLGQVSAEPIGVLHHPLALRPAAPPVKRRRYSARFASILSEPAC
ncbi:hypothetical protein AOB60_01805 [Streptomyces noursei]|uniref:Uncharacterized protein n=1 Tax=Streptomyces noursei TaxID=1971 RepID=A0A2N8PFW7_STRNR|nr:hypothetical protein AOB60_01805 [Streptomyces noursei]